MDMYNSNFNDKNVKIGHYTDLENGTGTTVILTESGAIVGVSVRGSAPGTRETDLANPMHAVSDAHAVVLTGGSAYGLDSASGVMQFLREKNIGYKTKETVVPIVPATVLYDLGYHSSSVFPDKAFGYEACVQATLNNFDQGSIGAGTGATCGKIAGQKSAEKTGLGISSINLGSGIHVSAIFAANPLGEIYDYQTNTLISGHRSPTASDVFLKGLTAFLSPNKGENTTIGVVFTNARLTKAQANKLADIAHDGIALAVRPCHTMYDGDSVFALSTSNKKGNFDRILVAGIHATAQAIANAAYSAKEKK